MAQIVETDTSFVPSLESISLEDTSDFSSLARNYLDKNRNNYPDITDLRKTSGKTQTDLIDRFFSSVIFVEYVKDLIDLQKRSITNGDSHSLKPSRETMDLLLTYFGYIFLQTHLQPYEIITTPIQTKHFYPKGSVNSSRMVVFKPDLKKVYTLLTHTVHLPPRKQIDERLVFKRRSAIVRTLVHNDNSINQEVVRFVQTHNLPEKVIYLKNHFNPISLTPQGSQLKRIGDQNVSIPVSVPQLTILSRPGIDCAKDIMFLYKTPV